MRLDVIDCSSDSTSNDMQGEHDESIAGSISDVKHDDNDDDDGDDDEFRGGSRHNEPPAGYVTSSKVTPEVIKLFRTCETFRTG